MDYTKNDRLMAVSLAKIWPDPDQPREIDPLSESIRELSENIKAVGLIQPLVVRAHPDLPEEYMIISGERRYTALKLAQIEEVKVIIRCFDDASEDAIFKQQLSENTEREDLTPIDKALFIQRRINYWKRNNHPAPQEAVAEDFGKSPGWVSQALSVLNLDEDIQALAECGKVRDLNTLKKLNKTRSRKRAEAFSLIEAGDFNAKSFFSRRKQNRASESSVNDRKKVQIPSFRPPLQHSVINQILEKFGMGAKEDFEDAKQTLNCLLERLKSNQTEQNNVSS